MWFVPYASKTKAAAISQKISEANSSTFQNQLQGNISAARRVQEVFASVEYYEKQALPEAELIISQSTRSYRAGAMDYLEYILNLNRGIEIKGSYLDALNNLNQTLFNIDLITGKIL
ncbi:MAG: hypothetical protein U0T33_13000 [Bacteroidales bacterium]